MQVATARRRAERRRAVALGAIDAGSREELRRRWQVEQAAYVAGKHGVVGLTRVCAAEAA
jgi:NAD(P)-dependent dehydrogenase (short-subunit alcohol dehydrogenase family)